MLAHYMLWPCVCLSVTTRTSTKMAKPIKLIFGTEVSCHLFYTGVISTGDTKTVYARSDSPGNNMAISSNTSFLGQ